MQGKQPDIARRVADAVPVGIWVGAVPGGELAYANDMFSEIMGMPPTAEAEVGNYAEPYGVFTLDGQPYPEERFPFVRALQAKATVTVDDLVVHRPDGRRHIRAWAKPLVDEDGAMTHIMVAFTDITHEREALERLRGIDTITPIAVAISRARDGNVIHANPALCGILECDADEIIGRPAQDFYDDPDERARTLAAFAEAGRLDARRVWLRTPSGRRFPAAMSLVPITVSGEPGILGTITDLSALREHELRLERALDAKASLVRELHHRVKNNLQLVSSMLSLQAGKEAGDPSTLIREVRLQVLAMASIHELIYGTPDPGRMRLNEFIPDLVARLVDAGLRSDDVELSFALDPLEVDMEQGLPATLVLNELVINALKHGLAGRAGRIAVALRVEEHEYELQVTDDGPGFDASDERTDGVGLELVRALAEQLRGTIVFGRAEGGGTSSRLRVPRAGAEPR